MRLKLMAGTALGLTMCLLGCGGGEEYAYEVENPDSPEVVYAKDVRMYLVDMQESLRSEGPGAIDFEGYFEGMSGYGDEPPVGEHGAVFDEIHAGVKELREMRDSGAARPELSAKIDELIEKLPPTAQPSTPQ